MNHEDIIVVDCGYVDDTSAQHRAERVFAAGVGRRNLDLGPSNRILIKLPKTKAAHVLEVLPISDHKASWGATHSYLK